jgi:hypothetical protein
MENSSNKTARRYKIRELTRAEFISKASECEFNYLWKCTHKEQKGKACTEVCKLYQNTHL